MKCKYCKEEMEEILTSEYTEYYHCLNCDVIALRNIECIEEVYYYKWSQLEE